MSTLVPAENDLVMQHNDDGLRREHGEQHLPEQGTTEPNNSHTK